MKIVYFMNQAYEESLGFIRSMSKKATMHVILQVTPELPRGSLLDLTGLLLKAGIYDANPILHGMLPGKAEEYWSNLEGFHLCVYDNKRSLHPFTIKQGMKIGRLIKDIKPDLIFFDSVNARIALGSLFFQDTPWIIGVHDPEPHSGERNWRHIIPQKMMFKKARHFILHNDQQVKKFSDLHHIPADRISVIHLGINDIFTLWKHGQVSETNNVLFFGRISPYKGIEVFLDAISHVCQEVYGVKVNLIGSPIRGYDIPSIPALANGGSLNLIKRYIPPEELVHYIEQSTCVVCPYLDATQSGVVLTAYAFQKPVIATCVGGLPEYIRDNETGILIPPNDPIRLAEALIRFLKDTDMQERLKKGISEMRLDWNEITNQYLKLFTNILSDD